MPGAQLGPGASIFTGAWRPEFIRIIKVLSLRVEDEDYEESFSIFASHFAHGFL